MSKPLQMPKMTELRPRLTVIGVGGAGCNAINNMIAAGLTGVDFVVANTDAQALAVSSAEHRIQLGVTLTEGLGAGSKPEIGEAAAEEAIDDLRRQISGSHMVFIAGGMGGGTGTGAAAVIARIANELGILTVGIVTKPFMFEGTRRMRIADIGVTELKKYVDTLIVIPNQNLFRIANEKTTFAEAFVLADQVLYSGVACIVDLIVKEGLINLDFADVRTVMSGMGTAMMGTGEASGERRAIMAAEEAIANPLLDDVSLRGARGLLLSISGGRNLTLYEVDEAASRVREEVDPDANIIVGATFDESLGDRVRVSIVASGMMRQGETAGSAPPGAHGRPGAATTPPAIPQPRSHDPRAAQAASVSTGDAEIQRRLTAALQTDPARHGEPNFYSESSTPRITAPTPSVWQGPGSVLVEEAPLPVAPRNEVARTQAPPPTPPFVPELPVDFRRPARRMPEIDEFPIPAQREYRARAASEAPGENRQTPAKRPGLFDRLSGRSRRSDDSHLSQHEKAVRDHAPRSSNVVPEKNRSANGGNRSQAGPYDADGHSIELPEVFSRDRK